MKNEYTSGDLLAAALEVCENDRDQTIRILHKASELMSDQGNTPPAEWEKVLQIRLQAMEVCENDLDNVTASLEAAAAIGSYHKIMASRGRDSVSKLAVLKAGP